MGDSSILICDTPGTVKRGGRKLDHKTLEHTRRLAVARVRAGESPSDVIRSLGMNRTVIYRWLRKAESGDEALASTKGTGRPPKLDERQVAEVRRWMTGKDPRQHGFDFGLWTVSVRPSHVAAAQRETEARTADRSRCGVR